MPNKDTKKILEKKIIEKDLDGILVAIFWFFELLRTYVGFDGRTNCRHNNKILLFSKNS